MTESEREVWEGLVKGLRPEDVVMSNVRLTDERQDYEVDPRHAATAPRAHP